jgi:hypothetical protein
LAATWLKVNLWNAGGAHAIRPLSQRVETLSTRLTLATGRSRRISAVDHLDGTSMKPSTMEARHDMPVVRA